LSHLNNLTAETIKLPKQFSNLYKYGCVLFFYEAKFTKVEKERADALEMAKEAHEEREEEKA